MVIELPRPPPVYNATFEMLGYFKTELGKSVKIRGTWTPPKSKFLMFLLSFE